MTTLSKSLLAFAVVGAVAGFVAFFNFSPFRNAVEQLAGSSPVGTTFNTAKVASININPQSITSTSTSIYNGDASDRIVTDAFATCSGLTNMFGSTAAGLSTWSWNAATSSLPAPTISVINGTFNAMNITVSTTSGEGYTSTTTYTSVFARRWNAGTYMVFQTNGTSSAATCNVGVHYLAS